MMFKILMGCFLIVVAAVLCMIPPFIWGIPVGFAAGTMILKGLGKTTVQAAKGGAAAVKYVQEKNEQSRLANERAQLEEEKRLLAEERRKLGGATAANEPGFV